MRYLATIILLTTIALLSYHLWQIIPVKPCSKPVTYSLGTFDKRFDLTQEEFLQDLSEAEQVWEDVPLNGVQRNLFIFSATSSKVKVNLIYDYRQSATDQLNNIEGDLKSNNSDYLALKAGYDSLKAQYNTLNSSYQAAVQTFQTHESQYQADLDEWNSGPRTNHNAYNKLQAEEQALQGDLANIRSTEAELNTLVRQINEKVNALNTKARELNLEVNTYNTIGGKRGDTFTGGLYTSDEKGQRIDIYQFDSHTKLVRLLAHELGHALGLDHVQDKNAIMYELNQGTNLKPTQADIDALKTLCGVK